MSAHTPGPWTLFDDEIVGPSDEHIADVPTVRDTETRANIGILLVAPDLLVALREIRTVLLMEHTIAPDDGWAEFVRETIDPVIAKAAGAQ